jgi:tannase
VQPSRLNAIMSSGDYAVGTQMLCQWPTRPLWKDDSTFNCVNDGEAVGSWTYKFPSLKLPVY